MGTKNKNVPEFREPPMDEIGKAAAKTAGEFRKLSSGEKYILEEGFKMGVEFMINYNKKHNVNS